MKRTIHIDTLLKRLGVTQAQLAKKAGVNVVTIWRWKKFGIPANGPARALLERLSQEAAS